jgi:hypothetical protein
VKHTLWLGIEAQTWLEIAIGIIVEGLILSFVFYKLSEKSQKNMQSHIAQHLTEQTERLKKAIQQEKG